MKKQKSFAKASQLMVSGAIEVMNDWAHENFNSPLIEEDDKVIHINPEITEEMSALKTRRHQA